MPPSQVQIKSSGWCFFWSQTTLGLLRVSSPPQLRPYSASPSRHSSATTALLHARRPPGPPPRRGGGHDDGFLFHHGGGPERGGELRAAVVLVDGVSTGVRDHAGPLRGG